MSPDVRVWLADGLLKVGDADAARGLFEEVLGLAAGLIQPERRHVRGKVGAAATEAEREDPLSPTVIHAVMKFVIRYVVAGTRSSSASDGAAPSCSKAERACARRGAASSSRPHLRSHAPSSSRVRAK